MNEGISKPERMRRASQSRKRQIQVLNAFAFLNLLKATTMPEITMCEGKENNFVCPIRELCYRYKAKADPGFQSWFAYLPYNLESERCESFMVIDKTKRSRNIDFDFLESSKKSKFLI